MKALYVLVVALAVVIGSAMTIVGVVALTSVAEERCFYKGESIDGLNKICFYTCASGEAAVTIKSHQSCPMSIAR